MNGASDVTGWCYFFVHPRPSYLATLGTRYWLECHIGRRSGIADWSCSPGRYSGDLADSVECNGHLYCRDHHQSSSSFFEWAALHVARWRNCKDPNGYVKKSLKK